MIDLASIRNASFTLTPTGYNPEEVDRFLADLADQLAEGLSAAPAPEPQYESPQTFAPVPAPVVELPVSAREPADVDGLRIVIERTIGAMDAFVGNELASLKAATELETEELLHERERMLDEAADAARAHLDETRARAEAILAAARRDGEGRAARGGHPGAAPPATAGPCAPASTASCKSTASASSSRWPTVRPPPG